MPRGNPVDSALMRWIVGNVLDKAAEAGISQRDLASACNVSPAYWSHARGRASGVSLYVLCRAAQRLEVDPKDLVPSLDKYRQIRQSVLGGELEGSS